MVSMAKLAIKGNQICNFCYALGINLECHNCLCLKIPKEWENERMKVSGEDVHSNVPRYFNGVVK
jgi:hypothetical protein